MSRRLRPLLCLACLLALPALAAQSLESPAGCPGGVSQEETRPQAPANEAASESAAHGKPRAANGETPPAPRSRPRWQSFLPGMVR